MRTATTRNRFQHGSGCYTCRMCKCQTRSTGRGDNENVQLCALCFDLASIENAIMDECATPEMLTEAQALIAKIKAKGGKVDETEVNKALDKG